MGRSPCCDKVGMKKGPWTPEEDQKLLAYIEEHGHGSWRSLPTKAGLQRCGKSCRLRWTNYLRPDIKRGKFSLQEEQTIIQLHALLGNRWSAIATHLPKRTDNEIKNYWNTHLKKRLAKMGIDPITHKPKTDANLLSTADGEQSKNAANLSHMAQWESARLEAEARLVRESKLRSHNYNNSLIQHQQQQQLLNPAPCSTSASASASSETGIIKEECGTQQQWKELIGNDDYKECLETSLPLIGFSSLHEMISDISSHVNVVGNEHVMEEAGFTDLLLGDSMDLSLSDSGKEPDDQNSDNYSEDNKNYWNSILNLVNSSISDSMF